MKSIFTLLFKKKTLLYFLCLLSVCKVFATDVSGTINKDSTWTLAGSPYKIVGKLTVSATKTLTIEPGVEVQFPEASYSEGSRLLIQGTLKAIGNSSNLIKFTGGSIYRYNTRGRITIDAQSVNTDLEYIEASNLGFGTDYRNDGTRVLVVKSPTCIIKNCNFLNILGPAVELASKSVIMSNCSFSNGDDNMLDVVLSPDGLVKLTDNSALKVGLISDISTNVLLTANNIYYRILNVLTVPVGKTMTLESGVELNFPEASYSEGSRLLIQGTLKAIGNSSNLIKFTGGSIYRYNTRGRITIDAQSVNTDLEYIEASNLGFGTDYRNDGTRVLVVKSPTCIIKNCNFLNILGPAVELASKSVIMSNCSFSNGDDNMLDVVLSPDGLVKLTDNSALKVGLISDISTNVLLTANNIYYRILNVLTVPVGKTMTLESGVELNFPEASYSEGSRLLIQGTLKAIGNSSNLIKFTGGSIYRYNTRGRITIDAQSVNTDLEYIEASNLGFGTDYRNDGTRVLVVKSPTCIIKNCNFLNILGPAVELASKSVIMSNCSFSNGDDNMLDVVLSPDGLVKLTDNSALKVGLIADISSNDLLTANNMYYRILDNLTVPVSKTLTIEPGVEVNFPEVGYSEVSRLLIQGTLKAVGNSSNYIKFTGGSIYRYNMRGRITIDVQSVNTDLEYIEVSNLGFGTDYKNDVRSLFNLKSTDLIFNNCIFSSNNGICISVQSEIINELNRICFFSNYGGVVSTGGSAKFNTCNFVGNTTYGINNTSTIGSIEALNSWWGDNSGPYQKTTNPTGAGDDVSDRVLYNPWASAQYDCSEVVLPITVTNFQASLSGNFVNCNWQTAIELNASHFIVQHSANGSSFSDIGKVYAKGNNSTATNYLFTDKSPNNGINYYRLKMVDKDGTSKYSEIRSINFKNSNIAARIYPNPVKEKLTIELNSTTAGKASISITSADGKTIQQLTAVLQSGNNKITMQVAGLVSGTFLLHINTNGGQQVLKFVKD